MVLANAIYFKANWTIAFEKSNTRKSSFFLAPEKSVSVDFMNQKGKFRVGEVGNGESAALICEIPYAGNKLSMLLIVPKQINGANAVLKNYLVNHSVKRILVDANVRDQEVQLSLPSGKQENLLS